MALTRNNVKRKRLLFVNWKEVAGATIKKRVLRLKSNANDEFICPIEGCLHVSFKTQRGVRKHINGTHPWYLYFNEQPPVSRDKGKEQEQSSSKTCTHNFAAFTLSNGIGKDFLTWLQTPCGGGRSAKEAKNIGRRAMKFLMAAYGENRLETVLKEDYIDCCLGSPTIIMDFLKLITDEWGLQAGGALSYMKSISDLLDYRKANGVTDNVLRTFTVTEVYIRRGKENLGKQKKVEYGRNLDLESLISRNSWATLTEMEKVIPYHSPKYEYVWKKCNDDLEAPTIGDLTFATRFIITFLFLRVKCTRPMTFQFLTLDMIEKAKSNGGYVDQTQFKTNDKYCFDTLILTKDVLKIIDSYCTTIRRRLAPKCDYLLVSCNGTQYRAFGASMSLLVHQAIGKSVNPTRYRQIIESESATNLDEKERDLISKDQKHSSQVAKRIYQKRLSREVATEARTYLQKLTGSEKESHTETLAKMLSTDTGEPCSSKQSLESPQQNIDIDGPDETMDVQIVDSTELPVDDLSGDFSDTSDNDQITSSISDQLKSPLAEPFEKTIIESSVPTEGDSQKDSKEDNNIPSKSVVNLVELEVKKEIIDNEVDDGLKSKRFTIEEDRFLKAGVSKYGLGMWKNILKDSEYTFHLARTRDSLRMRAKTLKLNCKGDIMRKKYEVRSKKSV